MNSSSTILHFTRAQKAAIRFCEELFGVKCGDVKSSTMRSFSVGFDLGEAEIIHLHKLRLLMKKKHLLPDEMDSLHTVETCNGWSCPAKATLHKGMFVGVAD